MRLIDHIFEDLGGTKNVAHLTGQSYRTVRFWAEQDRLPASEDFVIMSALQVVGSEVTFGDIAEWRSERKHGPEHRQRLDRIEALRAQNLAAE